jgi:hypothetical protein
MNGEIGRPPAGLIAILIFSIVIVFPKVLGMFLIGFMPEEK